MLARIVATKLGDEAGRVFVVENRPGANAIIGSTYAAKARNDGSILLLVDRMTVIANPLLYKSLPYTPSSLVGISDLAQVDLFLSVRTDAPYKTWTELVAYAKANPGKVSIGSGGTGSVHHISMELLARAAGVSFTHVPYKGVIPALQDLLGGQISGVISGAEVIQPHVAGGKIRVLLVGSEKRSPVFPDVPTPAELGIRGMTLLPTTFTLFGPAGLSGAEVMRLNGLVRKMMSDPAIAARLQLTGLIPSPSSPDDIKKSLDKLAPALAAVIRDVNIHVE
jgi:tripartite-type tricarboxylate transporter receptor subunit TctC